MARRVREPRAPGFWPLAIVFALFVLFLYGPMFTIFVLSFRVRKAASPSRCAASRCTGSASSPRASARSTSGRRSAARCCWARW
ncbi:hypothetical protein HK414_27625 [Ramlibacter terrae]|uniref:ABC transporter permease n=1 Tax=Ramlibacter terrae TaxID=2732511 RepID=A0ABX6P6E0_9BURK|nr:hypothetical protein HK414_27625 [Ramlibacter terrae]